MLPPNQQSNEPLNPKQISVVLENISFRQEELRFTNKVIQREQTKSAADAAAIAHLEPAITRAKVTIDTQKRVLDKLRTIRTDLEGPSGLVGPNWEEHSEASEQCLEVMTRVDIQLTESIQKVEEQISSMEKHILLLCNALQDMEREIYSRRLMRDASLQHISNAESHRSLLEANIKLLKIGLDPIKNTPAEIWTRIFTLRVKEDMATYFASSQVQLIPPTTFKLSQVCRFWRRVVLSERVLWQSMAIYPDSQWLPSKIEFLKKSHSHYPGIPTLVYDLTGAITWGGTTNSYDSYYGTTYASRSPIVIGVNEISMFDKYSLRLLTYGYNNGVELLSSSFRQPTSVTLQITADPQPQHLIELLGSLSTFSRLEIVAKHDYPPIQLQLSSTQPQLTYLKLELATFQPFDIASYLGSMLEELHIYHNGVNAFVPSPAPLRLPKLKILGVTPPDTNFIRSLLLPKLDKVILYGPKSTSIDRISLDAFASGKHFSQARELELRNWPLFRSNGGDEWDVMSIMDQVVDRMHRVATLKCVDGYVDGSRLVGIIEKLKDTESQAVSILDTVVLDCCSGISRDNCDAIVDLVGKVEVYV